MLRQYENNLIIIDEYDYDTIMASDEWYYNTNKRRIEMIVKFHDDIVVDKIIK